MNSEHMAGWLKSRLPQIPSLKLSPDRTAVNHVLNWGGFVNQSFSVSDGTVRYHLKITDDPDSTRKLQAWHNIQHLLEQRYRAPEIISWIDFPEIGFAGLLQRHVNGHNA